MQRVLAAMQSFVWAACGMWGLLMKKVFLLSFLCAAHYALPRSYGPLEHRPNWGDPAPPRPPVLETGASMRPVNGGHFWRGP